MKPINFGPLGNMLDHFFNNALVEFGGLDNVFQRPHANIVETESNYTIELAVPGISKDIIQTEIIDNELIISAKSEKQNEVVKSIYRRREFNYNEFERRFFLTDDIDKDAVEATFKDGILSITLAKLEEAIDKGPLKIQIQ